MTSSKFPRDAIPFGSWIGLIRQWVMGTYCSAITSISGVILLVSAGAGKDRAFDHPITQEIIGKNYLSIGGIFQRYH